jgi:hypothetical protein
MNQKNDPAGPAQKAKKPRRPAAHFKNKAAPVWDGERTLPQVPAYLDGELNGSRLHEDRQYEIVIEGSRRLRPHFVHIGPAILSEPVPEKMMRLLDKLSESKPAASSAKKIPDFIAITRSVVEGMM